MNNNFLSVLTAPTELVSSMLLVGYRFHPTNEELINDYLEPKNRGHYKEDQVIGEINVCQFEPWDLPDLSKIKSDDQVWYFFCPRQFKYTNSRRSNRTTKAGYWKPTGKPIPVKAKSTKKQIGTKKTLVFYNGHPKGVRTGWIMHEYECTWDSNLRNEGEFVLCKLKKKPDEKTKKGEVNHQIALASNSVSGEPNRHTASDFENQNPSEITYLACNESEASQASSFENHNPNEISVNSACNEGQPHHFVASYSENENTSEICQLSPSQSEGGWSPSMVIPSNFEDQSTYDKGESSSQIASDFGSQNVDKETDISTFEEGDWSALLSMPSDFANQNHKKTDMSTPEDSHWSRLKTLLERNGAKAMFPEVDPQFLPEFLSELEAFFELDNSVNSAP